MRLELGTNAWLALREPEHAQEVWQMVDKNREHLRPWFPWVDLYHSTDDALTAILSNQEQARTGISLNLGLWVDNEFCGMAGFTHIDPLRQRGSLGYWLDQQFQGKGWMRKACECVLNHGFTALALKEIHAECADQNHRSKHLLEAIGFQEAEIVQGPDWAQKSGLMYLRYRLTHQQWNSRKL